MDAITLLKDDHKTVEQLFKRFEKTGDRAYVERRELVDRMIEELAGHAAIEEQLFYPVARAAVPQTNDLALESLEEHHIVKWVLSELDSMSPEDERFKAKVTVLIENVRHHIKEEERDFFPMVREELGRSALGDLGEAMAAAKKAAPTHAHPRAADTPPGNLVTGSAAAVADRIGDTVSGLAQGGASAFADVIATVLRRKKPSTSPTGSRATRRTATRVRSDAATATRTARTATRGASRTAATAARGAVATGRAAKAGAKGTSTSARKSTKRVATTAKRATTTTRRTGASAAKRTSAAATRAAKQTAATARAS